MYSMTSIQGDQVCEAPFSLGLEWHSWMNRPTCKHSACFPCEMQSYAHITCVTMECQQCLLQNVFHFGKCTSLKVVNDNCKFWCCLGFCLKSYHKTLHSAIQSNLQNILRSQYYSEGGKKSSISKDNKYSIYTNIFPEKNKVLKPCSI